MTETECVGKNWAIECEGSTDYVQGSTASNAKAAEKYWRDYRHLYFISVNVRRTTEDEDNRLD